MKEMNKLIVTLIAALVSVSTFAADNGVETLFNKNEYGLTLGGSHSLNDSGNKWGADLGVRAFPLNKYLGVEATAGFRDVDSGPVFDDTRLNGVLRLPLDKYRVAIELNGGARYDYDVEDYQWSFGPRLAYRLNSKVELFSAYRYNLSRQDLPVRREILFGLGFNL